MTTSLKTWVALNVTRLALSVWSVSRCIHLRCYMPVFLTWRYWRHAPQLSARRLSSQSSTVVKSSPSNFCSTWKCGGVPHLWCSLAQSCDNRYLCPTFGITCIDCAGSWWVHLWTWAQGKQPRKEAQDQHIGFTWQRMDTSLFILQPYPSKFSLLSFMYSNTNYITWGLLQHANNAQQAFSLASTPTLHNALPTLEKLHAAWQKASDKRCYSHFVQALEAGMAKLDTYYRCSAESDAHIMAMGKLLWVIVLAMLWWEHYNLVLNPKNKMAHFTKHWPSLLSKVEEVVQKRVSWFFVSFFTHYWQQQVHWPL